MKKKKVTKIANAYRVTLWHNDFEGPRRTMAIIHDFKIILNQLESPMEMYDLRYDMEEKENLISCCQHWPAPRFHNFPNTLSKPDQALLFSGNSGLENIRNESILHMLLVSKLLPLMQDFATHGDEAHQLYVKLNPGRHYQPTQESDERNLRGKNIYKIVSKEKSQQIRESNLGATCSTQCLCQVPSARDVPTLPFNDTSSKMLPRLRPGQLPHLFGLLHPYVHQPAGH